MQGARVTDAVKFHGRRGELKQSVREVRTRVPDRLRWRSAVSIVTKAVSPLLGKERMRIEEPVREVVLDLEDDGLRREVVLDARRIGVDLDRGEVLPVWTVGDVRRTAYLTGVDVQLVYRAMELPDDFFARIDTAAAVIIGRTFSAEYQRRAHALFTRLPEACTRPLMHHEVAMAQRAKSDADRATRWGAFAKTLLAPQFG